MSRDPDYVKLRHSRDWLRLRAIAMARCKGMCEMCHVEKAVEAHHIIPLQDSGNWYEKQKLCFDINNVQCLCHKCHLKVHRQLGYGKARTARVTARAKEEFNRLFFGNTPSTDTPNTIVHNLHNCTQPAQELSLGDTPSTDTPSLAPLQKKRGRPRREDSYIEGGELPTTEMYDRFSRKTEGVVGVGYGGGGE